jgi:hypothetical protein
VSKVADTGPDDSVDATGRPDDGRRGYEVPTFPTCHRGRAIHPPGTGETRSLVVGGTWRVNRRDDVEETTLARAVLGRRVGHQLRAEALGGHWKVMILGVDSEGIWR